MAIHTDRGSGIEWENAKGRVGELKHHEKRPSYTCGVPERATKGKWHACECTAHPSKNIHSFDTLLRRTYPQIQTIFLLLGLSFSPARRFPRSCERAFEHFEFFLSHRDKMFLGPQATLRLIVSQHIRMCSILLRFRSTTMLSEKTNERIFTCVRVRYVNHPQSSKLENMLSIH